jgi:hypothetical protein
VWIHREMILSYSSRNVVRQVAYRQEEKSINKMA